MQAHRLIAMIGLVAGAFMILVAGCAVGPDYVKPVPVAPDTYKEMVGWKVAQPKDDVLRGPWWELSLVRRLDASRPSAGIPRHSYARRPIAARDQRTAG